MDRQIDTDRQKKNIYIPNSLPTKSIPTALSALAFSLRSSRAALSPVSVLLCHLTSLCTPDTCCFAIAFVLFILLLAGKQH